MTAGRELSLLGETQIRGRLQRSAWMKEICQAEVAFSVGREHKCQMLFLCSLLNLFFFFQFSSPPSQPPRVPSTPPPAAHLNPPSYPRLPRVVPAVILLFETREGHEAHVDAGCSVTMVSLASRNGAKTRTCTCVGV